MASKGRKRKRSSTQEDLEAPAAKLAQTDFFCSICFELFKEPYVTTCGHSFCYACITKSLVQSHHCPVCKGGLPPQNFIHPNYSLNDIVAKYRIHANSEREQAVNSPKVGEVLNITTKMTEEDIRDLFTALRQRIHSVDQQEASCTNIVLTDFLTSAIKTKEEELAKVQSQLSQLKEDMESLSAQEQAVVPSTPPPPSLSPAQDQGETSQLPDDTALLSPAMKEVLARRKLRLHSNMGDLLQEYFSMTMPEGREGAVDSSRGDLPQFAEALHNYTKFTSFRELSMLSYGEQTNNPCSIVSSIEFDKDSEFFAVAGVTKKIKVFDYNSVVRNVGFVNHFPVQEMVCSAKLSSVCYNPYHKATLVSSDYEGTVCVWDTNIGRRVASHQEHSKRVWSVVYNPSEPNLFASGSDDCTVRLWTNNRPMSIFSLQTRANVCSVKFKPTNRYHIAYGSADHAIHIVDLRNPNEPLKLLKGHRKAVSYVQFISPNELVSASTDSELKLWNTDTGMCTKTYRGHINDKNFVGLTVSPNFIACGSEDNSFYVYSKSVSTPMVQYQFNVPKNILPDSSSSSAQPDVTDFVSSVSWKRDENIIVAANSQGTIKVLEMC